MWFRFHTQYWNSKRPLTDITPSSIIAFVTHITSTPHLNNLQHIQSYVWQGAHRHWMHLRIWLHTPLTLQATFVALTRLWYPTTLFRPEVAQFWTLLHLFLSRHIYTWSYRHNSLFVSSLLIFVSFLLLGNHNHFKHGKMIRVKRCYAGDRRVDLQEHGCTKTQC